MGVWAYRRIDGVGETRLRQAYVAAQFYDLAHADCQGAP